MSTDGLRRVSCAIAFARVLLALGSAFVICVDPAWLSDAGRPPPAAAYGSALLLIFYSLWVWRAVLSAPAAYLSRLTLWLDLVLAGLLIWSTGASRSLFYIWNVFVVLGCALQHEWRTTIRVFAASILLYLIICLPGVGRAATEFSGLFVRTACLSAVTLGLAHVGRGLLEQSQRLAGLQHAAAYVSAGRSVPEILGRIADSLTNLLEARWAIAALWNEAAEPGRIAFVNLDESQAERLLGLARAHMASLPGTGTRSVLVDSAHGSHAPFAESDALAGRGQVFMTCFPATPDGSGILVACKSVIRPSDRQLVELLATLASPLIESLRLQEQRCSVAFADERRRIAAELHDGLLQTLASIDLRLVTCAGLWRQEQRHLLGTELGNLKRLSEEALEEARGAVNELAPLRLREEGLKVHLERTMDKFRERTSLPVEATIHLADTPIPEPTALLLIGLLREGLNNIRKHARATQVTLTIARHGTEIAFRLGDNGVGFSPETHPSRWLPARHYGLAYLRERTAAVGGEVRVISAPGQGTALEARVPIPTEDRMDEQRSGRSAHSLT